VNRNDRQMMTLIVMIFIAVVLYLSIISCSSTEHRREALQLEHPDCFVMTDLTIECPDPFADTSAGFGASVTNQKIKKGKKKK